MKINVIGFPYNCDYEDECLDIIRLWRESDLEVRVIPISPLSPRVLIKLTSLGCDFAFHLIENLPGKILEANDVRRGIVVGLYNPVFFAIATHLRMMGCKLVWAGEPQILNQERAFYKDWGLCEYYVVKSFFHRALLIRELSDFKCDTEQILRIKPPFFSNNHEFNIVPHVPNSMMCIGKAGCVADPKFYPVDSWKILAQSSTPIRAVVAEWSDKLESIVRKPKWVDTMPTYKRDIFYTKVHCLVHVANRQESWLRFALDAMAHGAPVIAQNNSSWKELIRHGENGFLCNSPNEVSESIDMLAQDENLRIEMAIRARESLFGELIDNSMSALGWRKIFKRLA